jgi:hypothetical protein
MLVKVWIGGEGASELGDRDRPDGQRIGAIEALLLRIEPAGWSVVGATMWSRIRKFKVGAARGTHNHGDIHSIAGLVNEAYEAGCEVVAFTRDVDAEGAARVAAVHQGIAHAQALFPLVAIIGGPAIPAIEGWILALLGVRDSEAMSRDAANRNLALRGTTLKRAEDYVAVIEKHSLAALPAGCAALDSWIQCARSVLTKAISGAAAR